MTQAQTQLYFREWAAVRKAKPDADRHALHVDALGLDKSSKEFSNSDFDKVLAVFRAVSDPGNIKPQLRQDEQTRARLEHVLSELTQCLGVYVEDPASYVARLVSDRFGAPADGTLGIDDLSHHPRVVRSRYTGELEEKPSQLLQVVMTVQARLQALRRGKRHTLADMYAAAGIPTRNRRTGTDTHSPSPKHRGRDSQSESGAAVVLAGTEGLPGPEGEEPF